MIDKQALRERYSPQPAPKCHICGAEMTAQRMSASRITYACTGATYDDAGCHYAPGRNFADEHYEQSQATVVDLRDPDVLELIAALEAAEQRNAELEESHAQVIQARDFYKRTNEVVMKRVAELAAPGVHHISELEKVLAWIEKLPVPTQGATTNYSRLKSVVDSCREAVPVADEIVGWVREDDGDARDPLFLCGSVHPENGRAYNSAYYPVKRAAMLDAAPAPVVPEPVSQSYKLPAGWVVVPKVLSAENGGKASLAGEFSETKTISCPECFGDEDCESCDGSGQIEIKVAVSWTTIKAIWAKGVEIFALAPQQEAK